LVTGDRARHALAFARAALAARAALVAPPPPGNLLIGGSVWTRANEEVQLRAMTEVAGDLSRQWQGFDGSDAAPERLPIELAFTTLAGLLPEAATGEPEDADRELLKDVWPSTWPHTWWVQERLLDLASVLGNLEIAERVFAALASPRKEERILAVRAAAAITRRDLLRDSSGAVRPLAAIVADYRELLGRRPESW
jgi:hypothetical protein